MSSLKSVFTPKVPHKIKQPVIWSGLTGCADALAIATAVKNAARFFVVLTEDTQTAVRLEHELAFFLEGEFPILHFPEWEILPYDVFSPLPEIVSERLKTLALLTEVTRGVLVLSVAGFMQRLSPREHVLSHCFSMQQGEALDLVLTRTQLDALGYQAVSQVMQHAEFMVRDGIVDVFPMGSRQPFRIELAADTIISIRSFDIETQLSVNDDVDVIQLYPAHEYPFTEASIKQFRKGFREEFPEVYKDNRLYQDISQGLIPNGIESYLPLFSEYTERLFDYLPVGTVCILPHTIEQCVAQFLTDVEERFEQRKYDQERPLLAIEHLYLQVDEFMETLAGFRRIYLSSSVTEEAHWSGKSLCLPELSFTTRTKFPAKHLKKFLADTDCQVLLVAETAGHREALREKLQTYQLYPENRAGWSDFLSTEKPLSLVVASLDHGVYLPDAGRVIITESQLTGDKVQQRRRRKKSAAQALEKMVNDLNELSIGTAIVHQDYGVGRYLGLQVLSLGDIEAEFLTLEYANQDKIYVPVASLGLITRYTGINSENVPLHKLGTDKWRKTKAKALEKIHDVAVELLDVYAKRALNKGYAFNCYSDEYFAFADAFPFEETPDQQTTIEAILEDMAKDKPMDRVVCGDVGFGKTEVAMRAAFVAVHNGKQVAVLVPTTLLAQQHFKNFRDRFVDWPFRIEVLSRFVTAKKQGQIMEDLARGKVDIIIGTHKLLSKEVQYSDLGLVMIDEEHRFGVRQKEHLKAIRAEVDLLALTATPIPRTLNMAMAGVRDVSIIATPPANRHPVRTFVSEWIDSLIQEACQREIKRGGQMYFLHNDIKSMAKIATELQRLVPEARIEIAHGKMSERELERIMSDFYHQRFNVLLSTTIIESGIDVPTANTIIINRADRLGLAQLHQLRGRVGRSHHRAYAYFITPPRASISKDGIKRLEALESCTELGAGFLLSSHDMEIRGAGELLGDGQSGQIQEIGFSLYNELLERTVDMLRTGDALVLHLEPQGNVDIDLQTAALIPEAYLADIHLRLMMYKRIANAGSKDELNNLQREMIDRFGLLPEPTKVLFIMSELKQKASVLGVKKIAMQAEGGRCIFNSSPTINMKKMLMLIQTQADCYQFSGGDTLKFIRQFKCVDEKIAFISELLELLTEEIA